jgi:acyl-CoA thioesterase-1
LSIIVAGGTTACSGDDMPTGPSARTPIIVAFGDSLTSGPGLKPEQTYPVLLQQRINAADEDYRVINAGVG